MSSRTRAREIALQALYEAEVNPTVDEARLERFLQGRLRQPALVGFATTLVEGVRREQVAIDAVLDARAVNWRVARMAATDRAVLRIAVYEIMHTLVPGAVAVNEAIELARRYGTEHSPRFVAGLLGRVLADARAADDSDPSPIRAHVS
jgi:N utilization substance protein B